MNDLFSPDVVHHAPAVKHAVKHIAQHAPIIKQGFSMLTLFITNILSAAVFGGGAWYIRGRGVNGVKIDLANAQKEIQKLTNATPAA